MYCQNYLNWLFYTKDSCMMMTNEISFDAESLHLSIIKQMRKKVICLGKKGHFNNYDRPKNIHGQKSKALSAWSNLKELRMLGFTALVPLQFPSQKRRYRPRTF